MAAVKRDALAVPHGDPLQGLGLYEINAEFILFRDYRALW